MTTIITHILDGNDRVITSQNNLDDTKEDKQPAPLYDDHVHLCDMNGPYCRLRVTVNKAVGEENRTAALKDLAKMPNYFFVRYPFYD